MKPLNLSRSRATLVAATLSALSCSSAVLPAAPTGDPVNPISHPEQFKSIDWKTIPLNDPRVIIGLFHADISPEMGLMLQARIDAELKDEPPDQDSSLGSTRGRLGSAIIHGMVRNGHLNEAWELIEATPKSVRSAKLISFFYFSVGPVEQLLSRFQELEDPEDRRSAITNLIAGRRHDMAAFDIRGLKLANARERQCAGIGFLNALRMPKPLPLEKDGSPDIAAPGSPPDPSRTSTSPPANDEELDEIILAKAVQLVNDRILDPGNLQPIADFSPEAGATRVWISLQKLETPAPATSVTTAEQIEADQRRLATIVKLQNAAMERMIQTDVVQTLDLLETQPVARESYTLVAKAVEKFISLDRDFALGSLEKRLPNLDEKTRQRIVTSVLQCTLNQRDRLVSKTWVSRLSDPDARAEWLQKIEAEESL